MLQENARDTRVGTGLLISLLYHEPEEIEIYIRLKREDTSPPISACTHKVSSGYLEAWSNNIEPMLMCLCYCLKKKEAGRILFGRHQYFIAWFWISKVDAQIIRNIHVST